MIRYDYHTHTKNQMTFDLKKILFDHDKWLQGDKSGRRANFQWANLREANLQGANVNEHCQLEGGADG